MSEEKREVIKEQLRERGAYEVLMEVAQWMDEELAPHYDQISAEHGATFHAKARDLARLAHSLLL